MWPMSIDEKVIEQQKIRVRMPEGTYAGTAKLLKYKTPRGYWTQRTFVSVKMDRGIPFRSDDNVYGESGRGTSIDQFVACMREKIMQDRVRYEGRGWRPRFRCSSALVSRKR